jgi:hypothetical protein
MSEKASSSLLVTPEAQVSIERLCERWGVKKNALVERVMTWLDRSHEGIQAAAVRALVKGYEIRTLEMILEDLRKAEQHQAIKEGKIGRNDVRVPELPTEQPKPKKRMG